MKTEKDLRNLAKRVHKGEIFLTNEPEIISMSFMIFALMDQESIPKDIGAVYEELSQAGPRSINGYPIFFSANILTMEEYKTFRQYYMEFNELMKAWD